MVGARAMVAAYPTERSSTVTLSPAAVTTRSMDPVQSLPRGHGRPGDGERRGRGARGRSEAPRRRDDTRAPRTRALGRGPRARGASRSSSMRREAEARRRAQIVCGNISYRVAEDRSFRHEAQAARWQPWSRFAFRDPHRSAGDPSLAGVARSRRGFRARDRSIPWPCQE